MDLAEALVVFVVQRVLEHRKAELKVLERDTSKLENVKAPFPRVSYDDAAKLLKEKGLTFEWGGDFGAPDETAISESFDRPVCVHRYPSKVKAFYMKGTRVQSIIRELRGEKIDIVEYSDDPIAFVTNALSPAKVQRVSIVDDHERVMVLRGVKDRLRRFNVAVSEVEHQDLWQRAGLGVVTVAGSEALAGRELQSVLDEIHRVEPGLVSRSEVEFLT